jgi:hypothetical protein
MMTETTPSIPTPFTAADKMRLMGEALDALRGANAIDERETVTLDPAYWVPWYDSVVTTAVDIKILAGAMEIELAIRRGQWLNAGDERRGGDHGNQHLGGKVTQRVTLTGSERVARTRDGQLGAAATLVKGYIQEEMAAGRVPSKRGALRVATGQHSTVRRTPMTRPQPAPHATPRTKKAAQFSGAQLKAQQRAEAILTALDAVANGQHHADGALRRLIRQHATVEVEEFLKCIRLIPWLSITRDDRGTTFRIDNELRAICEGLAPRTTLPDGLSIAAFLQRLRGEITRRRKENHEGYRKRKWTTEASLKLEMHDLLNWIEDELQKVDDVLGS